MFFVSFFIYINISVNCLNTRRGSHKKKSIKSRVLCKILVIGEEKRWVCLRCSVNAVLHAAQSFIETRKEYNLFYWVLLFLLVFMIITLRGEYICVRAV